MKVSVLTPTLPNRHEFLTQCVASVKAQTYRDIEHIVLEDMGGISKTRNECQRRATGELFFILDDDDYLEPTCIEKELELLKDNDLVFCDYRVIDREGKERGEFIWRPQTFREMLSGNHMPHGSKLFRRELAVPYDEDLPSAVDYDMACRMFLKKPDIRIAKVPEKLLNYRLHGDQQTFTEKQADCARKIREKYAKYTTGPAQ